MKKALKIPALILALTLSVALFVACGEPEGPGTEVTFLVEVVDDKGESTEFTVTTTARTLSAALLENGLVEGEEGAYGLYIEKVNGLEANYDVNQSYWAIWIEDEKSFYSASDITPEEGVRYKLVYTIE